MTSKLKHIALLLVAAFALSASHAGVITQSGPRYAVASGGGSGPTYVPWLKSVLGTGTVGANASNDFNNLSGRDTKVSNDITGPFGESQIVKVTSADFVSGNYGGSFLSSGTTLAAGDVTWLRAYFYFPSSFCAGFKFNAGESGDGDGQLKFLRYDLSNGQRITAKIGGLSHAACTSGSSSPTMLGVATEVGTGSNNYLSAEVPIARDQWVALQWKLTHGTTKAASDVEMWVGTTYLGHVVMDRDSSGGGQQYPGTTVSVNFIALGDYWNGLPQQSTFFYISNAIFTKQTPNTLDSGGRAYISPSTRISDFP
jgi:hypothetical protein